MLQSILAIASGLLAGLVTSTITALKKSVVFILVAGLLAFAAIWTVSMLIIYLLVR